MTSAPRVAVAFLACSTAMGCLRPHSRAQIEGFQPQALELRASEAVYFGLGDALHFSADGRVSPGGEPLWRGPRQAVWVAPDRAHVLVVSGQSLRVLDQRGRELKSLAPANRVFAERPAGQDTYWDTASVQWSPDGSSFFLFRRSGNAVGPVALHRYRLGDPEPRELTKIDHPSRHYAPSDGYFLSDAGDAVFYTLAERDDDFAWYRFDLGTSVVRTVKDVRGGVTRTDTPMPSPGDVAFSFERGALAGRNDAGVGWSWVRDAELDRWLVLARWLDPSADGCTVFSLHGDQLMPILHTRKSSGGYSATRNCGVRLDESYFLPGGRQALLSVDTLQHEGLLVIDTEDGRHGLAPEGLEVYFPLHTRNVKRVAMGRTGPQVEVGLDFEALQPRLSRATAPSGGSR